LAVHRNARRLPDLAADAARFQTEELIERYGNQWLATARRSCSTSADAEDAYQRALVKLLVQPPAVDDPEQTAAWLHTVIRNEGLQIVRAQKHEVDAEFDSIAEALTSDAGLPAESLEDSESHGFAKEALRRLRPDQTRCLLLRADGFDYPEICKITGFSYAKVNRLLSEGRKAARTRVEAITGGRECERIEPLLSMIADGAADAAVEHDARMHLENCPHCRATLRDYTLAPRDLAAAFPLGLVAAASWHGRILAPFHRAAELLQAKLAGGSGESSLAAAKKALAVFAVGATVVGGGAVIKQANGGDEPSRPAASKSAAAPAAKLLAPVAVPDHRVAERRRSRARAREEAAGNVASTTREAVNDPRAVDQTPANDVPADQDTGVATDPKDTGTDGAGAADQGGVLQP
jgi:RNA polymerase sigma factor (sigma-70 family)